MRCGKTPHLHDLEGRDADEDCRADRFDVGAVHVAAMVRSEGDDPAGDIGVGAYVRLILVLPPHFVQHERMPARIARVCRHVIFARPAAQAKFFHEVSGDACLGHGEILPR